MLIVFRKPLIFLLAMLQLFAPLVHAHSGEKIFNQGLHIPGLEAFYSGNDTSVIEHVNLGSDTEGLLIMVDAGINNPQDFIAAVDTIEFGILPSSQLHVSALPIADNNFSPHPPVFGFQRFFSTLPSRAPPAL